MFIYEALECLGGGGRRGRMDVAAHVACAVAVGGVTEHPARRCGSPGGSCKTPRWAAPRAAPVAGYLADATCLTQTYSIDKAGPAHHVHGLQGAARTG